MVVKLDQKDLKIIYELDLNSRQSDSQLGRKVGLSQQVVNYRIRNLVKNGVIRGFYTVIDAAKLGYGVYKVYFKLQNLTPENEKLMVDFAVKMKNMHWVSVCGGRWDLGLTFFAKNVKEFGLLSSQFIDNFSHNILSKDVFVVSEMIHFSKKYMVEKRPIDSHLEISGEAEKTEIDELDEKILSMISKNARMGFLEIAENIGTTFDVVRYRVKKMINSGLITRFGVWLDQSMFGYSFYKILLTLQNLNKQRLDNLINFCKTHPNVTFLLKTIGSCDMEVEVEVRNDEELRSVILDLRNNFPGIIRDFEPLHIFKNYKWEYYPMKG